MHVYLLMYQKPWYFSFACIELKMEWHCSLFYVYFI